MFPSPDKSLFDDKKIYDKKAEKFQMSGVRKDGLEFPAEVTLKNFGKKEGEFLVCFIRDITDKVLVDDKRKKQGNQCQRSQQAELFGEYGENKVRVRFREIK